MIEPRVDSITYSFRRGSQPRTLREGDEKHVKGVLMVRQQQRSFGYGMVSNGRPVWEWVEWGSERDRHRNQGRYRTLRHGIPVPPPPEGWKILECGRPIPKEHMAFKQEFLASGQVGWFGESDRTGREAQVGSVHRAFAIRKSTDELIRDHFEQHCVCIQEQKMVKQPVSVSAAAAVKKYLGRCKCGCSLETVRD